MNIKIPYSWLTDFIKTDVKATGLAKDLSLCSASVERIDKIGNDSIFDIEVTTNRIDMMSVYGIARETKAVLSKFGFKSQLKPYPKSLPINKAKQVPYLKVSITNESLCPRFSALLIKDVTVKNSPQIIIDRLQKVGVRNLNNLIDITNYCMYEIGQPMHVFDYDKIGKHTMALRESKPGEKIITLDGVERKLPPGTIIIEDGDGKIIDLCGIMGGANSAVSEKTKNVLLFVQAYDPTSIRRTCQELSFRTDAAVRFEKGMDKDSVFQSLERAAYLFKEHAGGNLNNNAIDIYPHPFNEKTVSFEEKEIKRILGIEIPEKTVINILTSLDFSVKKQGDMFVIGVPSFRANDINIPEDIIEEIARIYGYFNIPSIVPIGQPPNTQIDNELEWEDRLKQALKYWGFIETYTFSLISKNLLLGEDEQNVLKLTNPLTLENEYLRPHLLPSLLNVIVENESSVDKINLFEISKTYQKQGNNFLPKEEPKLAIVLNGGSYYDIKGIIEQIFNNIGRADFSVHKITDPKSFFLFDHKNSALLPDDIGIIGEINRQSGTSLGLKDKVAAAEIDCQKLLSKATQIRCYQPVSPYPPIIEDLTLTVPSHNYYIDIINLIKKASSLVKNIEQISRYHDALTLRVYFQSSQRTLTDEEIAQERSNILQKLEHVGIILKI